MSGLLRRLGPLWQVQRRRRPALVARAEEAALGLRGRAALVAEVRALRERLAGLERDHLLLAAHVAVVTEQTGTGSTGAGASEGDAAARARLAAVAFYEQRIGALEDGLRMVRRARMRTGRATSRRASGERTGSAA